MKTVTFCAKKSQKASPSFGALLRCHAERPAVRGATSAAATVGDSLTVERRASSSCVVTEQHRHQSSSHHGKKISNSKSVGSSGGRSRTFTETSSSSSSSRRLERKTSPPSAPQGFNSKRSDNDKDGNQMNEEKYVSVSAASGRQRTEELSASAKEQGAQKGGIDRGEKYVRARETTDEDANSEAAATEGSPRPTFPKNDKESNINNGNNKTTTMRSNADAAINAFEKLITTPPTRASSPAAIWSNPTARAALLAQSGGMGASPAHYKFIATSRVVLTAEEEEDNAADNDYFDDGHGRMVGRGGGRGEGEEEEDDFADEYDNDDNSDGYGDGEKRRLTRAERIAKAVPLLKATTNPLAENSSDANKKITKDGGGVTDLDLLGSSMLEAAEQGIANDDGDVDQLLGTIIRGGGGGKSKSSTQRRSINGDDGGDADEDDGGFFGQNADFDEDADAFDDELFAKEQSSVTLTYSHTHHIRVIDMMMAPRSASAVPQLVAAADALSRDSNGNSFLSQNNNQSQGKTSSSASASAPLLLADAIVPAPFASSSYLLYSTGGGVSGASRSGGGRNSGGGSTCTTSSPAFAAETFLDPMYEDRVGFGGQPFSNARVVAERQIAQKQMGAVLRRQQQQQSEVTSSDRRGAPSPSRQQQHYQSAATATHTSTAASSSGTAPSIAVLPRCATSGGVAFSDIGTTSFNISAKNRRNSRAIETLAQSTKDEELIEMFADLRPFFASEAHYINALDIAYWSQRAFARFHAERVRNGGGGGDTTSLFSSPPDDLQLCAQFPHHYTMTSSGAFRMHDPSFVLVPAASTQQRASFMAAQRIKKKKAAQSKGNDNKRRRGELPAFSLEFASSDSVAPIRLLQPDSATIANNEEGGGGAADDEDESTFDDDYANNFKKASSEADPDFEQNKIRQFYVFESDALRWAWKKHTRDGGPQRQSSNSNRGRRDGGKNLNEKKPPFVLYRNNASAAGPDGCVSAERDDDASSSSSALPTISYSAVAAEVTLLPVGIAGLGAIIEAVAAEQQQTLLSQNQRRGEKREARETKRKAVSDDEEADEESNRLSPTLEAIAELTAFRILTAIFEVSESDRSVASRSMNTSPAVGGGGDGGAFSSSSSSSSANTTAVTAALESFIAAGASSSSAAATSSTASPNALLDAIRSICAAAHNKTLSGVGMAKHRQHSDDRGGGGDGSDSSQFTMPCMIRIPYIADVALVGGETVLVKANNTTDDSQSPNRSNSNSNNTSLSLLLSPIVQRVVTLIAEKQDLLVTAVIRRELLLEEDVELTAEILFGRPTHNSTKKKNNQQQQQLSDHGNDEPQPMRRRLYFASGAGIPVARFPPRQMARAGLGNETQRLCRIYDDEVVGKNTTATVCDNGDDNANADDEERGNINGELKAFATRPTRSSPPLLALHVPIPPCGLTSTPRVVLRPAGSENEKPPQSSAVQTTTLPFRLAPRVSGQVFSIGQGRDFVYMSPPLLDTSSSSSVTTRLSPPAVLCDITSGALFVGATCGRRVWSEATPYKHALRGKAMKMEMLRSGDNHDDGDGQSRLLFNLKTDTANTLAPFAYGSLAGSPEGLGSRALRSFLRAHFYPITPSALTSSVLRGEEGGTGRSGEQRPALLSLANEWDYLSTATTTASATTTAASHSSSRDVAEERKRANTSHFLLDTTAGVSSSSSSSGEARAIEAHVSKAQQAAKHHLFYALSYYDMLETLMGGGRFDRVEKEDAAAAATSLHEEKGSGAGMGDEEEESFAQGATKRHFYLRPATALLSSGFGDLAATADSGVDSDVSIVGHATNAASLRRVGVLKELEAIAEEVAEKRQNEKFDEAIAEEEQKKAIAAESSSKNATPTTTAKGPLFIREPSDILLGGGMSLTNVNRNLVPKSTWSRVLASSRTVAALPPIPPAPVALIPQLLTAGELMKRRFDPLYMSSSTSSSSIARQRGEEKDAAANKNKKSMSKRRSTPSVIAITAPSEDAYALLSNRSPLFDQEGSAIVSDLPYRHPKLFRRAPIIAITEAINSAAARQNPQLDSSIPLARAAAEIDFDAFIQMEAAAAARKNNERDFGGCRRSSGTDKGSSDANGSEGKKPPKSLMDEAIEAEAAFWAKVGEKEKQAKAPVASTNSDNASKRKPSEESHFATGGSRGSKESGGAFRRETSPKASSSLSAHSTDPEPSSAPPSPPPPAALDKKVQIFSSLLKQKLPVTAPMEHSGDDEAGQKKETKMARLRDALVESLEIRGMNATRFVETSPEERTQMVSVAVRRAAVASQSAEGRGGVSGSGRDDSGSSSGLSYSDKERLVFVDALTALHAALRAAMNNSKAVKR